MMAIVYSATVGTNADVFSYVLDMHVPDGSTIADVTFGRGVFWKKVDKNRYRLKATDLMTGVDFRQLPYGAGEIDALVLDPPYMHTPGGTAHRGHQNYEAYYRNNEGEGYGGIKYHDAVLRLYMDGITEALRVLRAKGVLILKCQDQVCAGHMRLTSVELSHFLVRTGWTVEDLFVVVAHNRPGISRLKGKQKHSRRNHSYFLVASKREPPRLGMRLENDFWP
jgi:hypothetical protein